MEPTIKKILISACLLGQKVRYDGKHSLCEHPVLKKWHAEKRLIPLCPEVAGGLPTPRPASEIVGNGGGQAVLQGQAQVISITGLSNTAAYLKGARKALELVIENQIVMAILKARSPSCGNNLIYDGSFQGRTIPGMGATAALLVEHGVRVFNEDELEDAIAYQHDEG